MSNSATDLENDSVKDDFDAVDDEYTMPCAEAILAGTLALMTGHARCACAQHRDIMASKAASNLILLARHPLLSEGFKTVAFKMHTQWLEMIQMNRINHHQPAHSAALSPLQAAADAVARTHLSRAEQSRALWHTTPEVIQ